MTDFFVTWLIEGGVGPALAALPVNWAAAEAVGAARGWFRRLRRTDDLSGLVRAATGSSVDLTHAEFGAMRRLLEDPHTWALLGRGTVEDLATRIGDCLPTRDGRTAEDSRAAGLTIARGLLEFAVADLDPRVFQQLLLTRLERMETDQASALEEALLDLHADLAARFTDVMGQFKRVLDRLPPGPARRGEVVVYLKALIDWLNTDPWPRDGRFGGRALTPAAIERKLRVTSTDRADEQNLDADVLAQQCRRLVILGGPGSGKTWLAKRSARRCAEAALDALGAGGSLDEVELPLYTTCSRLFIADGNIREAAICSALNHMGDLGGSRVSAALRVFFTERSAPQLLVIDSLDEARGNDERLRQADTLPWRVILTSRPSSWNGQLAIDQQNDYQRVGELQRLRYPGDVEPFILRWFAQNPDRGEALAAQIARRPGLQQAATVPLILAFYCIVGDGQPLPEFRRDLYTRVLKRLFTGRWRGGHTRQPDVDACLDTLWAWAWAAATSHPVSGIGTWADDFPAERTRLGEAEGDAVDHIATPLGPPDVDTGKTLRRFIHRSIREHLVAEHIASLPVDQAVEALLPHIWYDPDWEYAAPAAIAMHPDHDQLLRALVRRAAKSDQIPEVMMSGLPHAEWEFRALLARVAAESSEADWSPPIAGMITQARLELARSGHTDNLGGAALWETSNRQVCDTLVGNMTGHNRERSHYYREGSVEILVQLAPTAHDERRIRNALLELLAKQPGGFAVYWVDGVVQLALTPDDKRQVREALLGLLDDKTRRLPREELFDAREAAALAGGVVQLDPTADNKRQARKALLRVLTDESGEPGGTKVIFYGDAADLAGGVVQLDPTPDDKRQARNALLGLLDEETRGRRAAELAGTLIQLTPTIEDIRHARQELLRLLSLQTLKSTAGGLGNWVAQFAPTADDKRQARETILSLLAGRWDGESFGANHLVGALVQLAPTVDDKRQARDTLLGLLADESEIYGDLVGGVVQLATTAEDMRQTLEALLGQLADETRQGNARRCTSLVEGITRLTPTADDKRQTIQMLLGLLPRHTEESAVRVLAGLVAQLATTPEDMRQARQMLLGLLTRQADPWDIDALVDAIAQLDPTASDKRQAFEALLGLLADVHNAWIADRLAGRVVELNPTADDKHRAFETLLGLLADPANAVKAKGLARGMAKLNPTAEDICRARATLLGLLTAPWPIPFRGRHTRGTLAIHLLEGLIQLNPTIQDKRQAREALLRWQPGEDGLTVARLRRRLIQLDPTVEDVRDWRAWAVPPPFGLINLLAAARRNSSLADWLDALSSLPPLSDLTRQGTTTPPASATPD